jgi:acyl-CoA dehydrogenase
MPVYNAPTDDVMFLLNDVFHIERHNNVAGFGDATPDVVEAMLVEAGKLCSEVLTPLNRTGDIEGCAQRRWQRHHAEGLQGGLWPGLRAGGWVGLSCPAEYGGQGLPGTLSRVIINEFLASANMAFSMYPA